MRHFISLCILICIVFSYTSCTDPDPPSCNDEVFLDIQFSNYDGNTIEYISEPGIFASYNISRGKGIITLRSNTKCITGVRDLCYADNDDYESCRAWPKYRAYTFGSTYFVQITLDFAHPGMGYVECMLQYDPCCDQKGEKVDT